MADDRPSIAFGGRRLGSFVHWYIDVSKRAAEAIWNLCILLAAVLVFIVSAQVFTRYVLGFVPLWGGELARYLGIWIALLLMGALVRLDRHLQVEIVFRRFSGRRRRFVRSIQLGLIIVLGWLIFEYGAVYALRSGTGQESPSLNIEMFWIYLILPISGLLLMFFASAKLLQVNVDPETLDRDYRARFRVDDEVPSDDTLDDQTPTGGPMAVSEESPDE